MNYKYTVDYTNNFKKIYKKIKKQKKELEKIKTVINKLACGESLEEKYRDHKLINSKNYIDCRECHITPDWLLIYRVREKELILLLIETGSHSDLF